MRRNLLQKLLEIRKSIYILHRFFQKIKNTLATYINLQSFVLFTRGSIDVGLLGENDHRYCSYNS